MLKIIIAEDDSLSSSLLRKMLEEIESVKIIKVVDNGRDLIKAAADLKPDVLFVDIYMPKLSGLEAAREIFNIDPNIILVFVTAHSDYALEAFDIYAFDYIVKPFSKSRLKETISRIEKITLNNELNKNNLIPIHSRNNDLKIFVKSMGNSYFINTLDIIMVTRIQRKTVIYTSKDTIETYEGLEIIEKKLPKDFIRCHKGYIINLNMIREITPSGSKTCIVKFVSTKETALATMDKVKIIKDILRIKSII